jgi:hypothetical protein
MGTASYLLFTLDKVMLQLNKTLTQLLRDSLFVSLRALQAYQRCHDGKGANPRGGGGMDEGDYRRAAMALVSAESSTDGIFRLAFSPAQAAAGAAVAMAGEGMSMGGGCPSLSITYFAPADVFGEGMPSSAEETVDALAASSWPNFLKSFEETGGASAISGAPVVKAE